MRIVEDELRRCTNCGLCLSSCPTFVTSRAEGDSPRGRVRLMELIQAGGEVEARAMSHLSSCIECGACHEPCPTSVRVAVARRAQRSELSALPASSFEHHVAALSRLIGGDPGTALTVDAVRTLLPAPATTGLDPGGSTSGQVLPLYGPLLRRAAPALVRDLEGYLATDERVLTDDRLLAALERAGGLLLDCSLSAEHDASVADAVELLSSRGAPLTVAVFDWLFLRLCQLSPPADVQVLPAHQVFPVRAPLPASAVWDHAADAMIPISDRMEGWDMLPRAHAAAASPVLLSGAALRIIHRLTAAKRIWLAGRTLITMDARSLVRFRGSRHLAEFLLPAAELSAGASMSGGG